MKYNKDFFANLLDITKTITKPQFEEHRGWSPRSSLQNPQRLRGRTSATAGLRSLAAARRRRRERWRRRRGARWRSGGGHGHHVHSHDDVLVMRMMAGEGKWW